MRLWRLSCVFYSFSVPPAHTHTPSLQELEECKIALRVEQTDVQDAMEEAMSRMQGGTDSFSLFFLVIFLL